MLPDLSKILPNLEDHLKTQEEFSKTEKKPFLERHLGPTFKERVKQLIQAFPEEFTDELKENFKKDMLTPAQEYELLTRISQL